MATYIKIRAISRSQQVRVGDQKVPNTASVAVDLDNPRIRRDLQNHLALGAVIVVSGATDSPGTGITAGALVDQGPSASDMNIRVSAGSLTKADGTVQAIAGGSSAVSAADGTNPRIDNVVVSDGSGNVSVVAGTAAANPVPPAIAGGTTKLAEVRVPANDTAITDDQITNSSLSRFVTAKHLTN